MQSASEFVSNQGMKSLYNLSAAHQTARDVKTIPISPVLQVDGLHFQYAAQALITDFSSRVLPGVTLMRGGSGRGKSTLLRLLAGALRPNAGQLSINGICLQDEPVTYRQQVFWIEPGCNAFDQITALDYFDLQRKAFGSFTDSHLALLVEGLGLGPHLNKPLYMLSTGSKRKVWLAAGFASGAAVTLLDEPFAALDTASTAFLFTMLESAAAHPTRAWVIAHHDAPGKVPLAGLIDLGN